MSCERICNICGDDLDSIDKVQVLSCGHEFCNECIFDWFQNILNNMKKTYYTSQYLKPRECPMCRQTGGYLKLFEGDTYVCGIHGNKKKYVPKIKPVIICCGAKLKTKNKLCKNKGKECYGYYCGLHKKFATQYPKNIETVNEKIVVTVHPNMKLDEPQISTDISNNNIKKKKKKSLTSVNKYFSKKI